MTAVESSAITRFRSWLVGILALAAVLRIGLLVYADRHPDRFDFPDSHRYVRVAQNIRAGLGPVDSPTVLAGTDPLYPYLLSASEWLGFEGVGDVMRFGRILNALFSAASVALVAVLGRRLVGPAAGLIAAALLAVDPILLYFNALVLTETAYIALLLAAAICVTFVSGPRGTAWAGLAGLLLGLGAITRSTSLLLIVFFLAVLWIDTALGRRQRLLAMAALTAGFALCLTPVAARNGRLFHRFVPVRTGGGASLLEALGPWADGGPGMDRIVYPPVPDTSDECERDGVYRSAAIQWAVENPARAAQLAWAKLRRTWSITIQAPGYGSPLFVSVGWLTVAPIFVLSLVGIVLLRRRRTVLCLLLAPAAYFTLVHMLFVGSVRYRLPAMPFLFVLAATALAALRRGTDNGGSARRPVA